jgi:hypothetical protein
MVVVMGERSADIAILLQQNRKGSLAKAQSRKDYEIFLSVFAPWREIFRPKKQEVAE